MIQRHKDTGLRACEAWPEVGMVQQRGRKGCQGYQEPPGRGVCFPRTFTGSRHCWQLDFEHLSSRPVRESILIAVSHQVRVSWLWWSWWLMQEGGEAVCFHPARSAIHLHSPVSGLCHLSSSMSKCTLQGRWSQFQILPCSSSLISIVLKVKLCPQLLVGSSLQRLLGYFHFLF